MAKKELKKLEIKIDELEQLQRSLWKYKKNVLEEEIVLKNIELELRKIPRKEIN